MKKIITITVLLLSFSILCGFSMEDAKRAKLNASIAQTVSAQEDQETFMTCASTKDSTVAKILADKEKMQNLNNLPIKDLENLDKVTKSCNK